MVVLGERLGRGSVNGGVWRAYLAGTVLLAGLTVPAWAGTLELRADVLTTEAVTQTVVARGGVRITDGVSVARAGKARYAPRDGRLVLSDGVVVRTADGTVRARDITILLGKGQRLNAVTAVGGVQVEAGARVLKADRVFYDTAARTVVASGTVTLIAPPDLLVSGGHLVADLGIGVATLTSRARVQNTDGFIEGDRLEVDGRTQTAFFRDHIVAGVRKMKLTADTATLEAREQKAVFRGRVKIVDPNRTVTADQVTVYLREGRIIAEGAIVVRLEEERP